MHGEVTRAVVCRLTMEIYNRFTAEPGSAGCGRAVECEVVAQFEMFAGLCCKLPTLEGSGEGA